MQVKDVVGKTVVITGTFSNLKRNEAEAALTALGAIVTGSISKKTNILFAGEKAGSKLEKAEELDIPVYAEATLEALLASQSGTKPAKATAKAKPAEKKAKPAEKKAKPAVAAKPAKPAAKATAKPAAGKITSFDGKNVALTGTFTSMKRNEAQERLEEAGAIVNSGVTKATEILIYGEKAGSKLAKAEAAGIALMSEDEMNALLDG